MSESGPPTERKLTSKDFYKVVRTRLRPWAKEHGFKAGPSRGMANWNKRFGDHFLIFWFQCNKWGWDRRAGSSFAVEFEWSTTEAFFGHPKHRDRFAHLLDAEELEAVRWLQNKVITKLVRPSRESLTAAEGYMEESWGDAYLKDFDLILEPYKLGEDIWFRYYDVADIEAWVDFIVQLFPMVSVRFLTSQGLDIHQLLGLSKGAD